MIKELEKAVTALCEANAKRSRFVSKNTDVIGKMIALDKEFDKAFEAVKKIAGPEGIPGETTILVDDATARVMVIGGYSVDEYDAAKLSNLIPGEKFAKVVSVDSKKVTALFALGDLDPSDVSQAKLPRKALSPRVKIEIFAK